MKLVAQHRPGGCQAEAYIDWGCARDRAGHLGDSLRQRVHGRWDERATKTHTRTEGGKEDSTGRVPSLCHLLTAMIVLRLRIWALV